MDKRDCRGSEGSKSDCVFPVRFGIKPDLFYYSHIKSRKKRQIRFSFLFFFWLKCTRMSAADVLPATHVNLAAHRWHGASAPQNVTTQHFSFSTQRECKHAHTDARTHAHSQNIQPHIRTHTVALRPWKTADTSGQTRRRSVCGAAERFSSDSSCDGSSPPKGVETAVASKACAVLNGCNE